MQPPGHVTHIPSTLSTPGACGRAMSDIIWTHDAPFASRDVCFYRSNDDTLCRVNFDGSQQQTLSSRKMTYSPFVSDDVVYFVADDHTFWRIGIDGKDNEQQIGKARLGSAPFVVGDDIFYQGDDNSLRSIKITGKGDYQLGTSETASTPVATTNGTVIFQGTNGVLWRQTASPSSTPTQIGGEYNGQPVLFETKAAPLLYNDYVYFRGTDNRVWKVSPDGTDIFVYDDSVRTVTTPAVDEDRLFATPPFSDMICVERDCSTQFNLAYQCHMDSKPFAANGKLYIRGIDDHLWMVVPSPRTFDKVSGLRVESHGAFLCNVLMRGPQHAVGPVSPQLSGLSGVAEVDLTRASGLRAGDQMCPDVSIELGKLSHLAEDNVMFDPNSPDVAYYTLTGSTEFPNWHYQGARDAIVKPFRPDQSPAWCWVGSGKPVDPRPVPPTDRPAAVSDPGGMDRSGASKHESGRARRQ